MSARAWTGRLGLAALAAAFPFWGGEARAEGCGTYPDAVHRQAIYGAFSDCGLKAIGQPALWRGLPEGTEQVTRFVFTEGHGAFFRVVTVVEYSDGRARLEVGGARRTRQGRTDRASYPARNERLSPHEVARIGRLAEEADVWAHEVGTWDGDELFLHCQVLEMERVNAEGYRYSSVNISCNQPARLMPLVNEVVRLAGLRYEDGLFQ